MPKTQKQTEELIKFLEKLKETLHQTRNYNNSRMNELIRTIETYKNKIILQSWQNTETEK
jgi:hypothetical protein